MPLKWRSATMDTRAPRALSNVCWFYQRPSQGSVVGSVAPPGCHLAPVVVRAPLAVTDEGAQSDNRLATTRDELEAVRSAELSPRCDEPARLSHAGWSDSPARCKRCSVAQ